MNRGKAVDRAMVAEIKYEYGGYFSGHSSIGIKKNKDGAIVQVRSNRYGEGNTHEQNHRNAGSSSSGCSYGKSSSNGKKSGSAYSGSTSSNGKKSGSAYSGSTSSNGKTKTSSSKTKKTVEMPDCDDYDSLEDFLDDWDGCMPDGSDAEDYWDNW